MVSGLLRHDGMKTFSMTLVLTVLLTAFTASAEAALPAVEDLLSRIETNDNPNSAALAAVLRQRLEQNTLAIRFEAEKFTDRDNSCGTIGFLADPLPTVYLNPDPECGPDAKRAATLIHEYEHIRILEEEVFAEILAARETNPNISAEDFPAKVMDYIKGTAYMVDPAAAAAKWHDSPAEVVRLQRAGLLFQIYTESKAYLTARRHAGPHIEEAWSDDNIVSTLIGGYLRIPMSTADVWTAFRAARQATDYDAYLLATQELR